MTQLARETGDLKTPAGLEGMVERKIAEAYAAGLFDDLKDAGRPLDLRRNPFLDPAWRLAYHVLENAGMAPAWVEERRSIQEAITKVRHAQQDPSLNQARAEAGSSGVHAEIRALNKRIESLNLTVPHPAFRLDRIRY